MKNLSLNVPMVFLVQQGGQQWLIKPSVEFPKMKEIRLRGGAPWIPQWTLCYLCEEYCVVFPADHSFLYSSIRLPNFE